MKISGSLKAPVFDGQISTTDTRLTLDEAGITLEKIAMTLKGQPDGGIALKLATHSGEGQLKIKAESNLHSKPRTARVQISGNDFQAMNTREATISTSAELSLAISGELAINDGEYRAYGQNLDIRTGRLRFAGGALTQPGLDIEAVRRPAPAILVGNRACGSMRKPDFSLFSEPTMSQSNQLSLLVLGRPPESNTSSQDRNSMNQAAIMLGLGVGLALNEKYGEKLGIDEISIESDPDDTTNQASLLVGKYLSPKLFVSYGVGIFEPVSTLRLLYTLGSKWKLVGESSALRSSADLFYVIELAK